MSYNQLILIVSKSTGISLSLFWILCVYMSVNEDCQEQLDFKDMKLQMLLVSLKELTATKEVIQTLEQLLCEESSQLQEERRQVSR